VLFLVLATAAGGAQGQASDARATQLPADHQLEWTPIPDAAGYHVYRDLVSELANGAGECLLGSVQGTSAEIPEDPPPGQAFFYLVAWFDEVGEDIGTDSDGNPRVAEIPCKPARRFFALTPNGPDANGLEEGLEPRQNPATLLFALNDLHVGVYTHTGEVHVHQRYWFINGRAFPAIHESHYRSQIRYDGPFGFNWDSDLNARLVQEGPDVRFHDGTGRSELFTAGATAGRFDSPPGLFAILVANADDSHTLRWPDGTLEDFHAFDGANVQGALMRRTDPAGNTMTCQYDHQGLLVSTTDTMGRAVQLGYDDAGRRVSATDFAGRTWSYEYDAAGNLISTTSPPVTGTPNGNDFPAGKTTEFEWTDGFANPQNDHNLLAVVRPAENGSAIASCSLGYQTGAPGLEPRDRVAQLTLGGTNASGIPAGGTIDFAYTQEPLGPDPDDPNTARWTTTIVDRMGNEEVHTHNGAGNLLLREELTNRDVRPADPTSYTTEYTYDAEGNRLSVRQPEGNRVEMVYDSASPNRGSQGNVLEMRVVADQPLTGGRGNGHGGPAGDIVATWTYEPLYNRRLSYTEPRGNNPAYVPQNGGTATAARYTTSWDYVWQEGDPATNGVDDLASRFGIALGGVNVAQGDLNGDGTTAQIFDRPARSVLPSVLLDPASYQAAIEGDNQQDARTLYRWNDLGQLLETVDAEGNLHVRTYHPETDPDGDGSPTPTPPDGRTLNPVTGGYLASLTLDVLADPARNNGTNPTPAAVETTYTYDMVGNRTHVVDGRGVLLRRLFNQLDQVVEIRRGAATATVSGPGGDSATGRGEPGLAAPGFLIRFEYDANNRVVQRALEDRDTDRGVGTFVETSYQYDILDDLLQVSQEATSALDLVTRYRYDANQNPTQLVWPAGNTDTAAYDERDLMFQSTQGATGPRGGTPSTRTFDYDDNGNLTHLTDARGNEHDLEYDGFDRAVRYRDEVGDLTEHFYDPASLVVQRLRLGHPAGPTPADRAGSTNVTLGDEAFLYDERQRMFRWDRTLFASPGASPVRPASLVEGGLLPGDNRINVIQEFDRLDRPTFMVRDSLATTRRDWDGVGREAKRTLPDGSDEEWTYDANHNVVEVAETEISSTSAVAPGLFLSTAFYDALDRLTSSVDNIGQTYYADYDSLDALRAAADPNGPETGSIGRRSPGRTGITVPINQAGNVTRYTYDAAGRLLGSTRILTLSGLGDGTFSPAADTSNPLNPDGLITVASSWDPNSLPLSMTDDNGNDTTYTYDNLNRLAQVTEDDSTSRMWQYDGNHNPVQHVDAEGSTQTLTYDAANRLTQVGVVRAPGIVGSTLLSYQYDGLGRVTRSEDDNDPADSADNAVCTWIYDSLHRVVEEQQSYPAVGGTRTVDQAWEAETRMVRLTYPTGREIETTYDAADRVDQLFDTDPLNPRSAAFDWFGMGFMHTRTYGNGVRSTVLDDAGSADIGRDGVRRTTLYRHLDSASTLLAGFEHDYDRADNRLGETRPHQVDPSFGFPVGERWSFDSANRLVDAVEGPLDPAVMVPIVVNDSQSWSLDGVGNWVRLVRNGTTFDFTPNNLNEYDELQTGGTRVDDGLPDDAFVDPTGGTGLNHGHNSKGDLTDEGHYTLLYDFLGRPVQVIRNSDAAPVATYRYFADGRRVFREVTNRGTLNETRRYSWGPSPTAPRAGRVIHVSPSGIEKIKGP
jgi:YD repeat-containing protein